MKRRGHFIVGVGALCALTARLWAGGSGLNVAVVVNQNSTNSLQLANYFCELRQIPPQNVLRLSWTGSATTWTTTDFDSLLVNPLLAMLSSRHLTSQIDYVVLSMDLPFQVTSPASVAINSTSSSLFYGFKPDPNPACSMAPGSTNLYAGSESVFRATPPLSAASNSFLVTMITSSNLALAKQIVSQGVTSDSTYPTQTVFLTKNPYDTARNVRFVLFDNAIFNARLRGNCSLQRLVASTPNGLGFTFGFQGGAANYTLSGVTVAPGGIADNLTSYGGLINGSDQLNMLAFLAAGATATYGTVDEPCNYLEKFPNPLVYFYQARGFSLAEAYYQSVTNPYQGLMVGEPLAAPFASPATGSWLSPPANAILHGTTNLALQIVAADTNHPISQVDLFVDGTFLETLTNIPPQAANLLTVNVAGKLITYTVPPDATLNSIATGLADALNAAATTNATKVVAVAAGDRVELHSTDLPTPGALVPLSASSAIGGAPTLTTFLHASGTNFLDSVAYGVRGFAVTNTPLVGDYLSLVVTKLNGESITNALTNAANGISLSAFVNSFLSVLNADSRLQGADGVVAEDWYNGDFYLTPSISGFTLRALSPGWQAAQILTSLSISTNLFATATGSQLLIEIVPEVPALSTGPQPLDDYLANLQPRAHLYVTSGAVASALTFPLDTVAQPDGFHELTAVIYEGSHVRTQRRLAQTIRIQNTALSAVFSTPFGGSNIAVEATIPFSVAASTNGIATIELFSTGGSLGLVTGQATATFAIAGSSLDVGLHPFYAVVTATNGAVYRTETKWLRLVGADAPFPLSLVKVPPPTLSWPATAGRAYDILATTNLTTAFQVTASVTATNAAGTWAETNPVVTERFYRVRPHD